MFKNVNGNNNNNKTLVILKAKYGLRDTQIHFWKRAGFEHGLPPATRMRWPATRLHKETPVMLSQRGLRPPTLPGSSGGPAGRRPMSGTGVAKWQCLLTRRGVAGGGGAVESHFADAPYIKRAARRERMWPRTSVLFRKRSSQSPVPGEDTLPPFSHLS